MAVVETTTLAAPQTIVAWASGWIESFGPDDINDCFFTASRRGVSRRTWIPPLLPLALLLLSHQPLKPKDLSTSLSQAKSAAKISNTLCKARSRVYVRRASSSWGWIEVVRGIKNVYSKVVRNETCPRAPITTTSGSEQRRNGIELGKALGEATIIMELMVRI
ncbi:hypothetical protein BT96DRAFT_978508 [Gymnopus androsaceus JB14]|uniref:Uncharacterized protein n=1 Tax=Gymnopus androsaceus JB14 TaxID=1447944 RepID=A0A6A4HB11_9AGAR|nr:hypothetical protein BT96DRAFT_978508 [Gymnopus androsaceus JB14]